MLNKTANGTYNLIAKDFIIFKTSIVGRFSVIKVIDKFTCYELSHRAGI